MSGHAGRLTLGRLAGVEVAVCEGRAHAYEHGDAGAMRVPLETLRMLGCEALLLTNAAGSLRPEMGPGTIMLIRDHLNLSGLNPLVGAVGDDRFVAMTGAYDARLCEAVRASGEVSEGRLCLDARPQLRDAGRDPHAANAGRRRGWHVDGAGGHPRAAFGGCALCALSTITNLGAGLADEALSHAQTKREGGAGRRPADRARHEGPAPQWPRRWTPQMAMRPAM